MNHIVKVQNILTLWKLRSLTIEGRIVRELYDETSQHIFYECTYAQILLNQFRLYLSERVALPVLNPQNAMFGFTDVLDNNYL